MKEDLSGITVKKWRQHIMGKKISKIKRIKVTIEISKGEIMRILNQPSWEAVAYEHPKSDILFAVNKCFRNITKLPIPYKISFEYEKS